MKTALKFHVNYRTVFKWVMLYKKEGEARLLRTYKRPWNRTKKELEEKIALLKEKDPTLTIRKAKEILRKQGIKISIKGIWGIWKRYGYTGFIKDEIGHDFTGYIAWSKEAKSKFEIAKEVFKSGNVKETAKILNSIPSLPTNKLLAKIPDNFLNWKRRVEKMSCLMGEIPSHTYIEKAEEIYKELKRRKLYHSALRIGVMEVVALTWMEPSEKVLKKIKEVKKIINSTEGHHIQDTSRRTSELLFGPRFSLLLEEGITYTRLLKVNKAYETAKTCRKLLRNRKFISPLSMLQLGIMYMSLEDYREAENLILQAFEKVDKKEKKRLKVRLANIFVSKGDWRKASRFSRDAEFGAWSSLSGKYLLFSRLALIKGNLQKAISLGIEILSQLKKERFDQRIFSAFFTIASAYAGMGERVKAKNLLTKILPFFKKRKVKKYINIIEILLSLSPSLNSHLNKDLLPSIKLALLVKNEDYGKALSYAKKKYLMLHFYRYLFFFPETIIRFLEKGKPTGLPKTILRLPVFNKKVPVYNIRFLGNLIVHKNQKHLRIKLQPKDKAFLIHFALKAGEPDKEISLESLHRNFWKNSLNPSRNLSHLLVRIKKELRIPSHLLEVSYKKDNPFLINKGIHFITDYGESQVPLAQAKAFQRAGEWGFAKREYLQAFKLFRGEPFKKMYDDWSDDKRLEILFSYEKEVLYFAKELRTRGRKEEAEKLLKKAERVVSLERDESLKK